MPLSTPIQNLPSAAQAAGNAAPPEDPEVLRIIEDMEHEMAQEERARAPAPPPPPPAPSSLPRPVPQPVQHAPRKPEPKPLWSWNQENAQRAAIVAVIALVLFYPRTMEALYQRLPERYQPIVHGYDLMIRAVLLAIVLYVLMWKLHV